MSVARCQQEVSSEEYAYWLAFAGLEPFGDEWRQVGRVAAATWGPHLKKSERPSEEDFMPIKKRPPKRQSQKEMLDVFKGIAARQNQGIEKYGERI